MTHASKEGEMRSANRRSHEQLRSIGGCLRSVYDPREDVKMAALIERLSAIPGPPCRR